MKIMREITGEKINSIKDLDKYLNEFKDEDREYFIVIGLDTKNKPIYREIVHIGTLNETVVHPREIFKKAIMMSCHSIVIAHNHPSGDSEPSAEDREITEIIKKASDILGIKLLDSVIIGEENESIC